MEMNEKIGCYSCKYSHVCKYWGKWQENFPYKSDDHIKDYLTVLAKILAETCAYFEKK